MSRNGDASKGCPPKFDPAPSCCDYRPPQPNLSKGLRLSASPGSTLRLDPKRIRTVLVVIIAVLVAVDALTVLVRYGFGVELDRAIVSRIDSDSEGSMQTLFNTLLLAGAASACAFVASIRPPRPRTWSILAGIFCVLTIDESVMIHEGIGGLMYRISGETNLMYLSWMLPYAIACMALMGLLFPWLRELPRKTHRGMLWAAAIYGTGVFALESVAGYRWAAHDLLEDAVTETLSGIEEGFEMLGVAVFIYFALDYAGSVRHELTLRIGREGDPRNGPAGA